jgi:tetratricopeptide (TPR) repeat protein
VFISILLAGCFAAAHLAAQTGPAPIKGPQSLSPFSLGVSGNFCLPVAYSSQYFAFGGGGDLSLGYQFRGAVFPGTVFLALGGISYAYTPGTSAQTISLLAADIGVGVRFPITSSLGLFAFGTGGYWFGTFNDFSASSTDPYAGIGLELQLALSPTFGLNLGAQFKDYFGLWQGVTAGIGMRIGFESRGPTTTAPAVPKPAIKPLATPAEENTTTPQVEINTNLPVAFSIFYKYYDDHPIGTVQITNHLGVPISNVKVQFYLKHYMDEPKEVDAPQALPPESNEQVNIFALFTDTILNVTEETKAAAELVIDYEANRTPIEEKRIETVDILGRNAMTWDDNRKVAAYVTAKDPEVLQFARSVTSHVQGWEKREINSNIQAAIAIHEALDLYGLDYVPNPTTPYSEVSKNKEAIDFVQFPRETFQIKAGDCSDISILYTALLQAVGIDTAFITIPGHIFVAVNTKLSPAQAETALIPASEYIAYKGEVWVPVEITLRHQGFFKAWELGAKEWNENNPLGQAGFYPVQEAWRVYQPVGLPGAPEPIVVPTNEQILSAYQTEAQRYIDAALSPQIAKLRSQIKSSGTIQSETKSEEALKLKAMNTLGILYAKYGQPNEAESIFKDILKKKPYLPAMINLGNLYFIHSNWKDALSYYEQASDLDPNNPHVLLAIAKADEQFKNFGEMKQKYEKLKDLDPALAEKYAYLGEGTDTGSRAADVETQRLTVLWETQ